MQLSLSQWAKTNFGSVGPSDLDAWLWWRISYSSGSFSTELCSSLAAVTRHLCRTYMYVDPTSLWILLSCRLVPHSKNPGVRPIAIEEVCQRITCKKYSCVTCRCYGCHRLTPMVCRPKVQVWVSVAYSDVYIPDQLSWSNPFGWRTSNAFNALNH